ncbi:hypothetical protein NESM_000421700 [Novymonas esmeraldas]|uniref:Uncharacterized protein n=1 Tax=Novymonas esmeraldas TaxID=1808958 RepID=A0AAW0EN64_9TRYP
MSEVVLPLSQLVGSRLDAEGSVTATSAVCVLDGRAVLVGTSGGSVLVCTPSPECARVLTPHSDTPLHCGAVYDLAVSAHGLVATAGHDGVCCVALLRMLLQSTGVVQCRRISVHTVPVVAVAFLSDGSSVVTLGADGRVVVVEARSGAVLASVSCGVAATCMTCSLDEAHLFVGGRSLAVIDLQHAMRPTSAQLLSSSAGTAAGARTAAWLRLYEWAGQPEAAAAAGAAGESRPQQRTPHGTHICWLSVDAADGALTATFSRRCSRDCLGAEVCGSARWVAGGGRMASQTLWTSTSTSVTDSSAALRRQLLKHRGVTAAAEALQVRCRTTTSTRPPAKRTAASAALWRGRWHDSSITLTGGVPWLGTCVPAAEPSAQASPHDYAVQCSAAPVVGPRTAGEELVVAEAERDALQRECDALVFEIKTRLTRSAAGGRSS